MTMSQKRTATQPMKIGICKTVRQTVFVDC